MPVEEREERRRGSRSSRGSRRTSGASSSAAARASSAGNGGKAPGGGGLSFVLGKPVSQEKKGGILAGAAKRGEKGAGLSKFFSAAVRVTKTKR